MRYTALFGKTRKEVPKDAEIESHKLLVKGGFVQQVAAGSYSFLPLGLRVLQKIDYIIREELSLRGVQHLLMPLVHPASLWEESGRRGKIDVIAEFEGRGGGDFLLAPTHEETVTDLARTFIESYRDLPIIVNQNQWKYRDEIRVSGGLLRTREFLMQDAYSFDSDEEGLNESFKVMSEAYHSIFERIGLPVIVVKADSGTMGGKDSEEFMVESDVGEDTILICEKCDFRANMEIAEKENLEEGGACPKCKGNLKTTNTIELGHVFKLGTAYSETMKAKFVDKDGKQQLLQMGCYGIGITRVIAAAAEVSHDDKGIIWPESIAPFDAHLVSLGVEKEVEDKADELYEDLWDMGVETLFDDREASAGEKFADSDLIGIPHRIIISKKSLEKGGVEWKKRSEEEGKIVKIDEIAEIFSPGSGLDLQQILGGLGG